MHIRPPADRYIYYINILTSIHNKGYNKTMEEIVTVISSLWPIVVGFVTLVIVLAKMHTSIEVLQEKVKALFEIVNKNS